MTTVTATRIIPADPASTALLLQGPLALEFWPGVTGVTGLLSPLSASAALAGDPHRRLVVRAQPPRRTPTSYVTAFAVDADGLPSATGSLRVSSQNWFSDTPGPVAPRDALPGAGASSDVAAVRFELHTDEDYDESIEAEIAAGAAAFLDNLAAFAGNRTPV